MHFTFALENDKFLECAMPFCLSMCHWSLSLQFFSNICDWFDLHFSKLERSHSFECFCESFLQKIGAMKIHPLNICDFLITSISISIYTLRYRVYVCVCFIGRYKYATNHSGTILTIHFTARISIGCISVYKRNSNLHLECFSPKPNMGTPINHIQTLCCYYNQWINASNKTIVAMDFPSSLGFSNSHTNCLNNRNCDGNDTRMCTISICKHFRSYTITL